VAQRLRKKGSLEKKRMYPGESKGEDGFGSSKLENSPRPERKRKGKSNTPGVVKIKPPTLSDNS